MLTYGKTEKINGTVQIVSDRWSWKYLTRYVWVPIKSLTFDYRLGKSDLITVSWQICEIAEICSETETQHTGVFFSGEKSEKHFYFIIEKQLRWGNWECCKTGWLTKWPKIEIEYEIHT